MVPTVREENSSSRKRLTEKIIEFEDYFIPMINDFNVILRREMFPEARVKERRKNDRCLRICLYSGLICFFIFADKSTSEGNTVDLSMLPQWRQSRAKDLLYAL